jgi:CBS domain containing-hemolysin-like protein
VDEYGGFAGLVTIEDILEEIVGEIADEHDAFQRPPVEELPDGSMRVTARLPVQDLAELFSVDLPEDDDVETVGGLLARALGRVPIEGAQAEVGGLRLVAESTGGRRNRIDTLRVCRVSEINEDDAAGAPEEPEAPASTGATRHEEPARVEN